MNDPNTGFGGSNSHRHIEARVAGETGLASCPTCERPFTADDKAAQAKAEAHERARDEALERQMRAREEQAREDGEARGQAGSKETIDALAAELARFKDTMDADVAKEVDARLTAERGKMEIDNARKDADRVRKDAEHARDMEALKKKLEAAQRQLEQKTPNMIGSGAEIDLLGMLRPAFPYDEIKRVGTGVKGADLHHDAMQKGKKIGRILYELKDVQKWSEEYVIKARQDMIAADADWAILVVTTVPKEMRDTGTEIAVRENVIVCTPHQVVAQARTLRYVIEKMSKIRDGRNDPGGKMHAAIAAYVTGPGRERLQSAYDRTERMRKAGKKHLADTTKHVNDLEKMYSAQEHDLSDIFAEIDSIIEGEDDETE